MTASTLVASGAGGGSGSAGRGTPQPVQSLTGNTNPTTYGAFFGGTPTPPAAAAAGAVKTPAVANTVSYTVPQGTVAGGAPTLPIHLRSGQQLQQPLQQGSYFGAYQPPVVR
jgi:hypothetical protein